MAEKKGVLARINRFLPTRSAAPDNVNAWRKKITEGQAEYEKLEQLGPQLATLLENEAFQFALHSANRPDILEYLSELQARVEEGGVE